MESSLHAKGRFERASFVRHVAICLAALSAWVFREHVRAGNEALWILGITVLVNLLFTVVAEDPRWIRFSLVASPLFSLAGWTVLVHLTGGVSSPFIAGFWLELVLSAWTGSATGTLVVTAGAIAALWGQQALLDAGASTRPLLYQTAFLAAMGGVMLLLNRHWTRTQGESASRHAELMDRLRTLENEMDVLRGVGQAGENVARLAHALKNAIHSLRGFACLVDAQHAGPDGSTEAFDGLRAAIDRLEEITRMMLGGGASAAGGAAVVAGADTRRVIEEMIEQISVCFPGIEWRTNIAERLPAVHADRAMLREALVDLARNAAEAMNGRGEIGVETVVGADRLEIRIRDHGAGFTENQLVRTISPGFTTKPGGSGFGLFLTRRFVESHGGRVTVSPGSGGGAVFSVGLVPLEGGSP
jgi:signal transduction histidine kinase